MLIFFLFSTFLVGRFVTSVGQTDFIVRKYWPTNRQLTSDNGLALILIFMTPNYITMFLSTRTMMYSPQLFTFLQVVEAAMFYYYVTEFPHKILRRNSWYEIIKCDRMVQFNARLPYVYLVF